MARTVVPVAAVEGGVEVARYASVQAATAALGLKPTAMQQLLNTQAAHSDGRVYKRLKRERIDEAAGAAHTLVTWSTDASCSSHSDSEATHHPLAGLLFMQCCLLRERDAEIARLRSSLDALARLLLATTAAAATQQAQGQPG